MRVSWIVLLLVACVPTLTLARAPAPSTDNDLIKRAVFAEGALWVLSDTGKLFGIRGAVAAPAREKLPEEAIDLCAKDGHALVVTCARDKCDRFTVRRHDGNAWVASTTVDTNDEALVGMSCNADGLLLATSKRLVSVREEQQTSVPLAGALAPGLVASMHVTADEVLIGTNAGEWGGGLQRVDRRSGVVSKVESNESGALCGGPLNSQCDPVNGIAEEPWRAGCVAVAVGLVHFSPHGRVVEICGEKIRTLYVKAFGAQRPGEKGQNNEPSSSVAFFGLTRSGTALWAVGIDGLYRFDGASAPAFTPLPPFEKHGPFRVSFPNRDVVLVYTRINQRRSVSGPVPLLVPR